MEALYASLGHWCPGTLEDLWHKWLWECDCNAPPLEQCCDMNKMHILGLLCCLGESTTIMNDSNRMMINENTVPDVPVVHLYPTTPISSLSLRELFDQLECLQLNWGPILSFYLQRQQSKTICGVSSTSNNDNDNNNDDDDDDDDDHYDDNSNDDADEEDNMATKDNENNNNNNMLAAPLNIIKALMARLGVIAHHAYPTDGEVLNDPQHTTPLPPSFSLIPLTFSSNPTTAATKQNNNNDTNNNSHSEIRLSVILRKSLRQAICIMYSLLRVQSILSRCVPPPVHPLPKKERLDIISSFKQHHIESSMDLFCELQQMTHLAPGMRLVYRTNFAGMYNHVSQVKKYIYHHYFFVYI